jgi:pre-mRNA-splicing factor CWC22
MTTQGEQKTVQNNDISSLFGKTGGTYIPPAKLRALQAKITDKTSEDYQRLTWEALKKSLNGLINKVNVSNIKNIVPELFAENLIRGRGLLVKSLMKAQAASLPFTPVFAAVVAVLNTKFPMIGELLINRLLSQFRKAYKRSDKAACLSSSNFIAHLVNQRVANEIVALQILTLLLERPTDDSVEVAVGYMRQVGAFLLSESSKACNAVFERFRGILHEGHIDKRTQYMVEVLFQVRKDKFNENPTIPEGLDIVEEADQITHLVGLTDDLNTEDSLNFFHYDQEFLENEQKYEYMKREILGEESSDESGSDHSGEEDSSEDEDELEETRNMQIQDHTNTNLVNLRRAIYLTIMSSLNFEECAHKLLKLDIPTGQEIELVNMLLECCSQERTYVNFYGLLGERFCRLTPEWAAIFARCFEETYRTIHRFESNRIRNIAKFFSHCLACDALTWEVFALVRLTENDTTSSSRIFCKILFTELSEALGLKKLKERFNDKEMVVTVDTAGGLVTRGVFDGLFPKESPRDTRFAINYFTSIGLGALTEELREHLKNAPSQVEESSSEESASDSDSTSSSDSDSDSTPHQSTRRATRSPSAKEQRKRSLSSERLPVSRHRGRSPQIRKKKSRDSQSLSSRSRSTSRRSPFRRKRSPEYRKRYLSKSPRHSRNTYSPVRRRRSRSPGRYHLRRSRSRSLSRSISPKRRRYPSRSISPRNRSRSPRPRYENRGRMSRDVLKDAKNISRSPNRRGSFQRNEERSSSYSPKQYVHPSRRGRVPN